LFSPPRLNLYEPFPVIIEPNLLLSGFLTSSPCFARITCSSKAS
jgi:hypothetical protein